MAAALNAIGLGFYWDAVSNTVEVDLENGEKYSKAIFSTSLLKRPRIHSQETLMSVLRIRKIMGINTETLEMKSTGLKHTADLWAYRWPG